MDKRFLLKLAYRNLISHKLRTFLTLIGIVIGISAVVFLVSFGSGIERLVTSQVTGGDAFSLIDVGTGNSHVVKLNDDLISKIKDVEGVNQVETLTNLGGKTKSNGNVMDIAIFGVSGNAYLDWSGKNVQYGQGLANGNSHQAVINSSFASFLTKDKPQTLVGTSLVFDLILPKELSSTNEAQTFADQKLTIVGVIKDDATPSLYSTNANFSVAGLSMYSQLKVRIGNRSDAPAIRKKIEAYGLQTEYVGDTINQVQQFFNFFKTVLGGFGLIALTVALLGMFNTLTISLLERIKEVALMQIFGMSKRDVRDLFLTEALLLGLIGGAIGIGWGVLLGGIANSILNMYATRAGGDAVTVFYFAPWFLLGTMAAAVVIGFATGIYPASRATKVKPLEVLRYE